MAGTKPLMSWWSFTALTKHKLVRFTVGQKVELSDVHAHRRLRIPVVGCSCRAATVVHAVARAAAFRCATPNSSAPQSARGGGCAGDTCHAG